MILANIFLYQAGVKLTLAVGKTNGKGLSFGLTFADVGRGIPHPAAVAAYVGRQLHVRDDCFPLAYLPYSDRHNVIP